MILGAGTSVMMTCRSIVVVVVGVLDGATVVCVVVSCANNVEDANKKQRLP